jgi:integrase
MKTEKERERKPTNVEGVWRLGPSRVFKEGAYEVRYRDAFNGTRRKTFRTKQAALDFQASTRTDKNRGDFIDPEKAKTRFSVVAERWYDSTRDTKPKTRAGYRYTLDRYILPAIGDRSLAKLTSDTLQDFLNGLPEHLSPTTRRNIFRTLTPILAQAVAQGMKRTNPASAVKLPKTRRSDMLSLTAEEVVSVAEEVGPRYRVLVYTAAYTGMRAGELAALRVKNLDLLRGRITVDRSLSDVAGSLHFGPPKNGKVRSFAIPASLVRDARRSPGRSAARSGRSGVPGTARKAVPTRQLLCPSVQARRPPIAARAPPQPPVS